MLKFKQENIEFPYGFKHVEQNIRGGVKSDSQKFIKI